MDTKKLLLEAAANIKHCGDYGNLFWNVTTKDVWLTLGDGDGMAEEGETTFDEIERMLKVPGVETVQIVDEHDPEEGSGYETLGYNLGITV